jgi:hypothetical protein
MPMALVLFIKKKNSITIKPLGGKSNRRKRSAVQVKDFTKCEEMRLRYFVDNPAITP